MSQVAVTQLRRLGLPLEWYTAGELKDAVQACSADATLIDDPEGGHFRDRLHLTPEERNTRTPRGLHGYHEDEDDTPQHLKGLMRIKRKPRHETSPLIPLCDEATIMEGLRMLSNPMHLAKDACVASGLSAPHKHC